MPDDDFDAVLEAALQTADDALNKGSFKKELRALQKMSMDDIKASVPRVSAADYSRLVTVVELASARNLSQAELLTHVQALGKRAVAVARLIPGLLP